VRWITYEEANRLIDECSYWLRPLVIFLLYTGARCGEALWLDWRNIDLDRRHVQFIDTKNGESRGVPLHSRIVEMLRGVNNREGYVFTKRDGSPYRLLNEDDPNDVSAGDRIKKGFAGAVRRAGLTDFHPHDCRHTWATWHYQSNRDLGALQKLGGWKTLSMVLRYAHTNVAELDQTIDRMR
jgi:integrase